jgi:hypothetical protein
MNQALHGAPTVILPPGLLGTGWLVRSAVRRGIRGGLVAWTGAQALVGSVLACLMADHTLAVLVRRAQTKEEMWVRFEPHVRIAGVPYDFRLYGLLLLGVLTAWLGIGFVRSAWRLVSGDYSGWRLAVQTTAVTVAVAGPLIPLSEFPIQVLMMSGICLGCSAMARMYVTREP